MATMNLTEYAKHMGISFRTAQRWYRDGQLPHHAYRPGGRRMILVDVPDEPEQTRANQTSRSVIYLSPDSPTSTSEIKKWALQHGIRIDETHCRKSQTTADTLKQLLADPSIARIVTDSHPAADLISAALAAQGREFITTRPAQQTATPRPFKPRIAN